MARVSITFGTVSIEYEGEPEFLQGGLMELAAKVAELAEKAPPPVTHSPFAHNGGRETETKQNVGQLSTNTIAQTLDAKTGSELAFAAAVKIIVVDQKTTALRADILEEMKAAVSYYKDTYSGNLTASLETLMKNKKLNLVSKNTYSIPAAEMKPLEKLLANAG